MDESKILKQISGLRKEVRGGFKRVDGGFKRVDERLDKQDRKIGETLALVEDNKKSIKILGEGFESLNHKVSHGFAEMNQRFDSIEATYTPLTTHAVLDRRVTKLEKTQKA